MTAGLSFRNEVRNLLNNHIPRTLGMASGLIFRNAVRNLLNNHIPRTLGMTAFDYNQILQVSKKYLLLTLVT